MNSSTYPACFIQDKTLSFNAMYLLALINNDPMLENPVEVRKQLLMLQDAMKTWERYKDNFTECEYLNDEIFQKHIIELVEYFNS